MLLGTFLCLDMPYTSSQTLRSPLRKPFDAKRRRPGKRHVAGNGKMWVPGREHGLDLFMKVDYVPLRVPAGSPGGPEQSRKL